MTRTDVIALQIVTAGAAATAHVDALQAAGEYSEAYFAHGLAVEAAEGLAEYVHRRILADLGLEPGPRPPLLVGLSGVPRPGAARARPAAAVARDRRARHRALPGLPVHPEQTTAAIVIHHPQAVYFSARRGIRAG